MTNYRESPYDLDTGVQLPSSMDGTHYPSTGIRVVTSGGVALGSVALPVDVTNHADGSILIGPALGPIKTASGEPVYFLDKGLVLTVPPTNLLTQEQQQILADIINRQLISFQQPALEAEAIAKDIAMDPTVFHWHRCNTIDEMQTYYLSRLPAIREAARACGYAIGLHGSTRRDLDLIAVPWVAAFSSKDQLAKAIQQAACGLSRETYEWERKPNGRMAVSFPICWTEWHDMISAGHIDLSVMMDGSAALI